MIEQWQIYLTYHQWMGILPLKKRVYKSIYKSRQMEFRDKTEQFGVFAIGLFDGKLTLGDLFPPCHRRRNVDSNVYIELSTVAIDTNTVVINYRREEGGQGTTWVKP